MEEHKKGKLHTQGIIFSFETPSAGGKNEREIPGNKTKGI